MTRSKNMQNQTAHFVIPVNSEDLNLFKPPERLDLMHTFKLVLIYLYNLNQYRKYSQAAVVCCVDSLIDWYLNTTKREITFFASEALSSFSLLRISANV